MKSIIILFALFIFSISSFAQGYLYDVDQTGFSLNTAYLNNDGFGSFGLLPAYTWNGRMSVGLLLNRLSDTNSDFGSTKFGPLLSHIMIKQDEEVPVSMGLVASYTFDSYDESETKGNTLSAGASLHHELVLSDKISIIPGGSVSWVRTSTRGGFSRGSVNDTETGLFITLKGKSAYLEPAVKFSEGNSFIGAGAGFFLVR